MKKYIYIINNIVQEIIPEFVEDFPDVPITERYHPNFLKKCKVVDESVIVEQNDLYNLDTDSFEKPKFEKQIEDEVIQDG